MNSISIQILVIASVLARYNFWLFFGLIVFFYGIIAHCDRETLYKISIRLYTKLCLIEVQGQTYGAPRETKT